VNLQNARCDNKDKRKLLAFHWNSLIQLIGSPAKRFEKPWYRI